MAEGYQPFQKGSRVRLRLAGDERLVKAVRGGDTTAFEVLYDRYASSLLAFCLYMLASRHDAEDAVQATFASAYRSLLADERSVSLRPWLFTIARNSCLTTLRKRHPWVELNGEPALNGDPYHELEVRDEVRDMLANLRELPERQRATLVLSELQGLSQAEIATVLGVRSEQVKAYAYQARSNLISEKVAREADCTDIRKELATARGAALRKRRLRRHLRACGGCREYEDAIAGQRQGFAALLPVVPSLALKMRALQDMIDSAGLQGVYVGGTAVGGSVAGTAVIAGGSMKALVAKVAAGVVAIGAASGVGVAALDGSLTSAGGSTTSSGRSSVRLTAASGHAGGYFGAASEETALGRRPATGGRVGHSGKSGSTRAWSQVRPGAIPDLGGASGGGGSGKGRESHGNGGESSGKSGSSGGGSSHARKTEEERKHESEERAKKAQERQHKSEERKLKAEERQRKSEEEGHSGPRPPVSEQERELKHEEKQRIKASRPPHSEEERIKLREERKLKHEESAGP